MINNGESLNIRRKAGTAYPHFPLWCWSQGSEEKERTRWSMLSGLWKNPPSENWEHRRKKKRNDHHSSSTTQSITG